MAQQSEDLNFASGLEQFQNIRRMLPSYLNNIGLRMLEERKHRVEHLATIEDVNRRRTYLREQMLEDLGGFPDRTPLNARVVGVLERTGYRIEKIIFDSQPHFYVTANLYLPTTGRPPYPAILFPLGHERGGKTNPTWQQMLGSLATKGFVALAWDPVGQGERLQIFDEDLRESKVGNSTTEHTVVGTQCMLVGDHLARYTIWDGMRALDYLLSRKEVDPARIGLTGNSGGGTHTAYIAALDDRIQVAAPSCYITSWHLMLDTIIYTPLPPNPTSSFQPSATSSPSPGPARLLQKPRKSIRQSAKGKKWACLKRMMAMDTTRRVVLPRTIGLAGG
jgi:hypothetical protein